MSLYARIHLGRLSKRLVAGKAEAVIGDALEAAVGAAGPYVHRQLARNTPRGATGLLAQHAYFEHRGRSGFVGYRGAPSLYAVFPDQGTRPHWPPVAPIAYYVARKMGLPLGSPENARATYFVRRKISRVGTKPQRFVKRTADSARPTAQRLMRDAAVRVIERNVGR